MATAAYLCLLLAGGCGYQCDTSHIGLSTAPIFYFVTKVNDNSDRKRQHDIVKRIDELDGLIQSVYEDKVAGKVPEKVCIGLLEKYQAEKDKLTAEQDELRKRSEATRQDERDVDEYIRRMKSYAGAKKLTREMALELIEYIKVDAHPGHCNLPRTIHVFYKLIDKPLTNKRNALE